MRKDLAPGAAALVLQGARQQAAAADCVLGGGGNGEGEVVLHSAGVICGRDDNDDRPVERRHKRH